MGALFAASMAADDSLESLRDELQQLRREVQELRAEIRQLRGETATQAANAADEQQMTAARLDEQDQTKVSSGSRYHLRLSGMALLNVFTTRGAVDNMDLPGFAKPRVPGDSNGNFGAGIRQSLLSLDVSGPVVGGAKTSASLNFDFFGGFPSSSDGLTAGIMRLRTARLNFDWKNTSVVAGQDAPFFSPLSPTSLVSTAYPALSSSGNLWTWTPEVYIEHRISLPNESRFTLQWGILDSLTGELPDSEYARMPTAGERSRMPAYATRLSWQGELAGRSASVGAGAYYARQNWGSNQNIDAWAGTADWDIPLVRWLSLSGELYRGRAIGGLGGGASGSVAPIGNFVRPLNSAGGWSQLKFKPFEKIEFNTAFGEDYPFRKGFVTTAPLVGRNASGFFNVIYQARSNLLFSVEYRRLWTSRFFESKQRADHVSLGAGVIF